MKNKCQVSPTPIFTRVLCSLTNIRTSKTRHQCRIKRLEAPDIGKFWSPTILVFKKIKDPGDVNDEAFYQDIALIAPELLTALWGILNLKFNADTCRFKCEPSVRGKHPTQWKPTKKHVMRGPGTTPEYRLQNTG